MSDVEDEIKPKRKKGVRNTHLYQRQMIKDARIHGKSYKSYSGEIVPAITYNADCRLVSVKIYVKNSIKIVLRF